MSTLGRSKEGLARAGSIAAQSSPAPPNCKGPGSGSERAATPRAPPPSLVRQHDAFASRVGTALQAVAGAADAVQPAGHLDESHLVAKPLERRLRRFQRAARLQVRGAV